MQHLSMQRHAFSTLIDNPPVDVHSLSCRRPPSETTYSLHRPMRSSGRDVISKLPSPMRNVLLRLKR